mmetsp:Transcript_17352/g.52319  ORF Transcript_17352/g.52319 Transcript_17352/m.52319 type:complete len:242 (-) Transcript_17352:1435-2160(-)
MMMYIIRDINTAPRRRSIRTHQGMMAHRVRSFRSRRCSSSRATSRRSSASWLSCIHLPSWISSLNRSVVPWVHWKISISPPIWASTEKKSRALAIPSSLRFSWAPFGSVLACTMKEPVSVKGMIRRKTGRVPNSIWNSGSFRMPVRTDVGQSGPQTSTITLSICKPGWLRMCLIAFISGVWMATSLFTRTLSEKGSPINFCCKATAESFMTMANTVARSEARTKCRPVASKRLVMRMAEIM